MFVYWSFLYKVCMEIIAFEFLYKQVICVYSNFIKMHSITNVTLRGFFFSWTDALLYSRLILRFFHELIHQKYILIKDNVASKSFLFFMNYGNVYVQGFDSFMDWCNMCIHLKWCVHLKNFFFSWTGEMCLLKVCFCAKLAWQV